MRKALYEAIKINNINIKEKTNVRGFLTDDNGKINKVLTDNGDINCKNVVNAAGAWSPSIFDSLGIRHCTHGVFGCEVGVPHPTGAQGR